MDNEEQNFKTMPSPFPGMDPYLENPELWPEVHSRLIVAIADAIAPTLLPNYYAAIEKHVYLAASEENISIGIPDVAAIALEPEHPAVPTLDKNNASTATLSKIGEPQTVILPLVEEVEERYLEVRDSQNGQVITIIELLSPKNKRAGEGREAYLRKRQQILTSLTHWVEIDLLRSEKPMPMRGVTQRKDYRILISPSNFRPRAQLYAFTVRDEIPQFQLPLKAGAPAPIIAIKPILDGIYDRGGYQFRLDYRQPSIPPLSAKEAAWVREQFVKP